jgi:response regulator RpfG family c-di-GMP phosphodiesterase
MPTTSTLLIIDDCAEDRKIYRRYLLRDPHQSYRIIEADSAEEGLILCQEIDCDVILRTYADTLHIVFEGRSDRGIKLLGKRF